MRFQPTDFHYGEKNFEIKYAMTNQRNMAKFINYMNQVFIAENMFASTLSLLRILQDFRVLKVILKIEISAHRVH